MARIQGGLYWRPKGTVLATVFAFGGQDPVGQPIRNLSSAADGFPMPRYASFRSGGATSVIATDINTTTTSTWSPITLSDWPFWAATIPTRATSDGPAATLSMVLVPHFTTIRANPVASVAVSANSSTFTFPFARRLTKTRVKRPRTSSITAAVGMIWLARSCKRPLAARDCAVMPTPGATQSPSPRLTPAQSQES